MKDYRKNIPASERLSVTWTLSQIQLDGATRLVEYVKANDPKWDYGKPFDKHIFDNYPKNGFDVKV